MSGHCVLICGPSGSGKSTSLRALDPATTIILSTEQKPLPWRGAGKFKKNVPVASWEQFQALYARALASDADVIVVDSLTSLAEQVYIALIQPIERSGDKVMAAWQSYKDVLHGVLLTAKASGKSVVFLGIDDVMQDDQKKISRTCAVQGSLKGRIEKEFSYVLWSKVLPPAPGTSERARYVFATNSDGEHKAKTPLDMYVEQYIDNDIAAVLRTIDAYYEGDDDLPGGVCSSTEKTPMPHRAGETVPKTVNQHPATPGHH